MREEPVVIHDTAEEPSSGPLGRESGPLGAPTGVAPAWRWVARLGIALAFSLVVGALPVVVHREIRELQGLRSELNEMRALNETMVGRLEDSAARLRALKTPEGAARVMREKGFLPPGARVYQLELTEDAAGGSRHGMER